MAGERRLTSIKSLLEALNLTVSVGSVPGTINISGSLTIAGLPVPINVAIDSLPHITIDDIINLNIDTLPALTGTLAISGVSGTVNINQALTTSTPPMSQTNVTNASVQILAANANRKKVEIRNQHTSGDVYIFLGTPATLTNSRLLLNGESYEFPEGFVYTGIITAIGATAVSKPVSAIEWT